MVLRQERNSKAKQAHFQKYYFKMPHYQTVDIYNLFTPHIN